MSTFQCNFDHANLSSHSWDISKWRFYSYWWPDILVVCCHFYTSCICADSSHLGLYRTSFGALQCNLVCENWFTGCGDTSWIKFVTYSLQPNLNCYLSQQFPFFFFFNLSSLKTIFYLSLSFPHFLLPYSSLYSLILQIYLKIAVLQSLSVPYNSLLYVSES